MRGRSNAGCWGKGCEEQRNEPPAHHGPGQCWGGEEAHPPTRACRAPLELSETSSQHPGQQEKTPVGYENACPVRRRRSTCLPFLQKKKNPKPLHASFLDRPKRTHVKPACPPPPSQAGPLPAPVRGLAAFETCLSVWPAREE